MMGSAEGDYTRLVAMVAEIEAELPHVKDVDALAYAVTLAAEALAYAVTLAAEALPKLIEERALWAELAQSESDRCEKITRQGCLALMVGNAILRLPAIAAASPARRAEN